MFHKPFSQTLLVTAALAISSLAGCQSYERKHLDEAAASAAWIARSPSDESVRQFAERLAFVDGTVAPVFDPSDGLTLSEAEPVALVFNRNLRLARLEANVTRASFDFAGLWQDPVAGFDLESIVGGVVNPWVVAGTVGITLPISGRLEAEKAVAGAEYADALTALVAKEWATRSALREMWLDWSAQTIRAALAEEMVIRLRDVTKLAKWQEEAGSLSRIEARVFAVELAGREADVTIAVARATELELHLRDILGLAPEAPVQLIPLAIFKPRDIAPADLRAEMTEGNAELAAVRSAYEVAEESLQLEIKKQYPDLAIGSGYLNDNGSGVLVGLSLPVPLWNRNQQGVAEATANREVARARFETTFEHLASRLAIALTRYQAGQAVRAALEHRVVPLADEQDAEVRRVAAMGRVDPFLILTAIQAQHAAKVRLTDATAVESIGAVRLDELLGPLMLLQDTILPDAILPIPKPDHPPEGNKL